MWVYMLVVVLMAIINTAEVVREELKALTIGQESLGSERCLVSAYYAKLG